MNISTSDQETLNNSLLELEKNKCLIKSEIKMMENTNSNQSENLPELLSKKQVYGCSESEVAIQIKVE